jgi:hypothetical protein
MHVWDIYNADGIKVQRYDIGINCDIVSTSRYMATEG